jgi:hypothetical protein
VSILNVSIDNNLSIVQGREPVGFQKIWRKFSLKNGGEASLENHMQRSGYTKYSGFPTEQKIELEELTLQKLTPSLPSIFWLFFPHKINISLNIF